MGILESFESILFNVFKPLFEVTIDPATHPQLHVFLKFVSIPILIKIFHKMGNILMINIFICM
jgi:hypothetical protein